MIRRVTFASCYVYSPFGASRESERSRLLRSLLKASDSRFIFKYAERVRQQLGDGSPIAGFFYPDSVLVPVPGSSARASHSGSVADLSGRGASERGNRAERMAWPASHSLGT